MAKKLAAESKVTDARDLIVPSEPVAMSPAESKREYDLIGDVVFDPPLTPEERRRRAVGVSVEERLEQIRRRQQGIADSC